MTNTDTPAAGVFLDTATLGEPGLDLAELDHTLPRWDYHAVTSPAQTAARIAGAQVVVTNKVRLDAAALESAARLRLVCVTATGTDNVDLEAARRRGIAVCNVPGYSKHAVPQLVFALLLALYTHLPEYRQAVREGRWSRSPHFTLLEWPIHELAGKVMGILGYGELGRAVARLAEAFGMQVAVGIRPGAPAVPGRLPLRELLGAVDVLSLHLPLTPETLGMIGAQELALMKPTAVLINTARGGIVEEPALAAALRARRLGGAAVDVLTQEPPAPDHPLLAPDIPNLIVTPHIAWASLEARRRLIAEVAENIRAFMAGRERYRVA